MKKAATILIALLLLALTACGNSKKEEVSVDLSSFYAELEQSFDWGNGSLVPTEGDMSESYYPGLNDLHITQIVAVAPMMSAVVNELVFLEAESEEEAIKAEAILQKRIDDQVAGGAWYPESIAAWEEAEVIREGKYVALIASNERQQDAADAFRKLFE